MKDSSAALPKARVERLVVEELGDEVLVYDLDSDEAHCLSPTAALVWRHCDGGTSAGSVAPLLADGAGEELVWGAVEELSYKGLLADPVTEREGGRGWSRRELLVRMGGASATVATAGLITSIVAPIPEAAATHACPGPCTSPAVCCPEGTPQANTCSRPNTAACSNNNANCCSSCCGNGNVCVTAGSKANGAACRDNCECASQNCPAVPGQDVCAPA